MNKGSLTSHSSYEGLEGMQTNNDTQKYTPTHTQRTYSNSDGGWGKGKGQQSHFYNQDAEFSIIFLGASFFEE